MRQLSALTQLKIKVGSVYAEDEAEDAGTIRAATAAVAVAAAAQLSGLRDLQISDVAGLHDPVLLQLTALTALVNLKLKR
jgi:hypothetical protein